jgi:transposase-like protein
VETTRDCRRSSNRPHKEAKSTVLSIEEEAIIVAFRRHTLLPLDDCFDALQSTVPRLTRSSLHRCLQRHGISRLPEVEGSKPSKKKLKTYPIGYFHIDIAEVQTAEGKLYLYVAIDRTSKFAFVQLVKKTGRTSASAFLEALIAAVPYQIHTVLTDNGIQFTFPPRYADGPTARYMTHMFDMRCRENGIEHRLTKIKHPWTNGQVEPARSKKRPFNAIITIGTISLKLTWPTSSMPTTMLGG